MIRYNFTSQRFSGSASLIYLHNTLVCIDTTECEMTPEHRQWLYRNAPLSELHLPAWVEGMKTAIIVREDYEVQLEDFIREYPYKRNNHLLPDVWKKLKTAEKVKAWLAAKEYRRYCDRESQWYKPKIAAAWLKNKEYLNDWRRM